MALLSPIPPSSPPTLPPAPPHHSHCAHQIALAATLCPGIMDSVDLPLFDFAHSFPVTGVSFLLLLHLTQSTLFLRTQLKGELCAPDPAALK